MTRDGHIQHIDGNARNNDPGNLAVVDSVGKIRTAPSLHRDLLRAVGGALYGGAFHYPLAFDLGVSPRVVQRWASGKADIPPGIWAELVVLCRDRRLAIGKIEKQLRSL